MYVCTIIYIYNASKGESEKNTKTPHYNRQCNKSVIRTAAEYQLNYRPMNKKHSHTNYGHLLLGTITRGDGGEDPTTLRRYQSILVQLIIATLSFHTLSFIFLSINSSFTYMQEAYKLQIWAPFVWRKLMSGKKGHLPIQATPGDQTFLTLPFLPSRQTVYEKHKVGLARRVTLLTVKPGHLLAIVGSTSQLGQLFLI